jgi:hypothetical protein
MECRSRIVFRATRLKVMGVVQDEGYFAAYESMYFMNETITVDGKEWREVNSYLSQTQKL